MNAPPVVADVSDDERLQAVNARVSPDVGIVTESHRSGAIAVDYAVTNIRRAEPPADLFEVPTDYTFVRGSLPDDPLITFAPWRQSAPGCKPLNPLRRDLDGAGSHGRPCSPTRPSRCVFRGRDGSATLV